jgi:flagellar L-ring protein precursor FlgH
MAIDRTIPGPRFHGRRASPPAMAAACLLVLAGCAAPPSPRVEGPGAALPVEQPTYVERAPTGSLFNTRAVSMFSGRMKPHRIGDTVRVDISETLKASSNASTQAGRESAFSSKGPGATNPNALLADLMNQNMSASGSTSFKGSGANSSDDAIAAHMTASVIKVLANGYLVVAGERSVSLHSGGNALRFSGVVDPWDIGDGNLVLSRNVANARLEVVAQGDMAENTRRNWLQRVLVNALAIW